MPRDLLVHGPSRASGRLILAHGAGAPMDSPFMNTIAEELGHRELRVFRFEFPYMAARRSDPPRRPGPDPMPRLQAAFRAALSAAAETDGVAAESFAIGGKSLGGRVASMIADELGVRALICLGYPFHPPGQPEKTRTLHLATLRTPTLILQGERDPFGGRAEIPGYHLPTSVRVVFLPDGDHSWEPRKSSGRTLAENTKAAIDEIAAFLDTVP